MNPNRVTMPDIDVDFCFERRQEVIDYVARKYGSERVVQIVTFGTMAARGVIRDVGRVLNLPYAQVDSVAKMIPMEKDMTIELAMKRNPELKKLYDSDEVIHELIDMSKRLEGLPRHTSTHAGRRCDQSEGGGRICTSLQRSGRLCNHSVYGDNAGGTRSFKNGLFGTEDIDSDSKFGKSDQSSPGRTAEYAGY